MQQGWFCSFLSSSLNHARDGIRVAASRQNLTKRHGYPTQTRDFCLGGQPMFTRNSPPEPSKLSARLNSVAIAPVPQQHRTGPTDSGDKSIIGNDLKIIGQGGLRIISRGILQIDGEIEGDVQAAEVIIGAQGKV